MQKAPKNTFTNMIWLLTNHIKSSSNFSLFLFKTRTYLLYTNKIHIDSNMLLLQHVIVNYDVEFPVKPTFQPIPRMLILFIFFQYVYNM